MVAIDDLPTSVDLIRDQDGATQLPPDQKEAGKQDEAGQGRRPTGRRGEMMSGEGVSAW